MAASVAVAEAKTVAVDLGGNQIQNSSVDHTYYYMVTVQTVEASQTLVPAVSY